jgi:signal transduction histidine kinase
MIHKQNQNKASDQIKSSTNSEALRLLSGKILQIANSGLTRTYFLRKILKIISDVFKADEINVLLRILDDASRSEIVQHIQETFSYNFISQATNFVSQDGSSTELHEHWKHILTGSIDASLSFVTERGGFWIQDIDSQIYNQEILKQLNISGYLKDGEFKSLLVIPFSLENERVGLMELKSYNKDFLSDTEIYSIETFIHTLGMTFLNQYTQAALQERVKEISCLYNMSQIADKPYVSLVDLIYSIMDLLPPAWQYPEITQTRIIFDGIDYSLPNFNTEASKLSADIDIGKRKRGLIEVIYTKKMPQLDEGPFLKEERKLLDTIAKELALILKRRETEEDKEKLLNQLHHADRLATVGELAAGVAHEINEPLGSILGFAQLAGKYPEVPDQVKRDLEKIVNSSLHAREIVKKLMVFSRQVSVEKKQVSLNQIVEDSVYYFKSRCLKEGIDLVISLEPDMPLIIADPVQINQVIVNIVVNAMQAMPDGGSLNIQTRFSDNTIILIINDTGQGMNDDVLHEIFHPFYTTKEAGKGLGLGLSVVDGIIKSHNGEIEVKSEPGKGTEFIIKLPIITSPETNASE